MLDNKLNLKNAKIFMENGLGVVYFEPKEPLDFNSEYKVILSAGIQDTAGYNLLNDFTLNFKTEANLNFTTKTIDDFENIDNWSFTQNGTDTNLTSFNASAYRKLNGSHSGYLKYDFISDTASVSLSSNHTINEQVTDSTEFGVWIFGDNSKNTINLLLTNQTSMPTSDFTDTLNWTGWKFKYYPINNLIYNNKDLYYTITASKDSNGSNSGELYFDDASLTSILTSTKEKENIIPKSYSLSQNYPNPFNPSTIIKWQSPTAGRQTIKVYNILGNKVATLIDEYKPAGTYEIEFNTSSNYKNLASGIYFYQLKAGNFIQTKKMILMK